MTGEPIATEAEWQFAWFESALSEVVHEALEWFWIDGKAMIDPHGKHEMAVHHAVSDLAQTLWDLHHSTPEEQDA